MPKGDDTAEPHSWLLEVIAVLAIVPIIGLYVYQSVTGAEADPVITLLFVGTALSSVLFLFGIDRVRAAYKIWQGK